MRKSRGNSMSGNGIRVLVKMSGSNRMRLVFGFWATAFLVAVANGKLYQVNFGKANGGKPENFLSTR